MKDKDKNRATVLETELLGEGQGYGWKGSRSRQLDSERSQQPGGGLLKLQGTPISILGDMSLWVLSVSTVKSIGLVVPELVGITLFVGLLGIVSWLIWLILTSNDLRGVATVRIILVTVGLII